MVVAWKVVHRESGYSGARVVRSWSGSYAFVAGASGYRVRGLDFGGPVEARVHPDAGRQLVGDEVGVGPSLWEASLSR